MKHALITGGAGFIGTNLAHRLLSLGVKVRILDNLSRPGVDENIRWMREVHHGSFELCVGDVCRPGDIDSAIADIDHVFHFAAQVAVTTSVADPLTDFDINARGTLNVLEAIRHQASPPALLFTSTNKVYGALHDIRLRPGKSRYIPLDDDLCMGVNENRPLDFHSPYGCSKGSADQYVLDYSRIYGIRAAVFRMSCIYGCHQLGNEDQGWVAHFAIRALCRLPIQIFGDGRQVRDILFVDDLIDAFLAAHLKFDAISGRAFNIGGGPVNSTSLLELIEMLNGLTSSPCRTEFYDWRPGDQRYYVSDFSRFQRATGWQPRVSVREGVSRLHEWLTESHVAKAMQEA